MSGFFAPPDIKGLKAKGDIKGLLRALKRKEWLICLEATDALGQLGWQPTNDENGERYWRVRGDTGGGRTR